VRRALATLTCILVLALAGCAAFERAGHRWWGISPSPAREGR